MSFFPAREPAFAIPPGPLLTWEHVSGGGPTAIALDTVKNFLNIPLEDKSFDSEKEMFAVAAQAAVENYCHLQLLTTVSVGYAPAFHPVMRLNRRPFVGVDKVEYVERTSGQILTLDPATYVVGRGGQKTGVLMLGEGQSWPDTAVRPDAVRITVKSGWAKADIPAELTSAVLMTIASLDHARADDGGSGGGAMRTVYAMKHMKAPTILPDTAQAMVARHRYLSAGTT